MVNNKAELVRVRKEGEDPRVDEILANPQGPLAKLFQECLLLNRSKVKKPYLEAALLSEPDLGKVSAVLDLPVELLKVYIEFFYPVATADRLTKLEHIDGLRDRNEILYKTWALNSGLDFLAWRMGKSVTISPVYGLNDLFTTCVYKSKEAMFNPSNTEASKEAIKWARISMELAKILKIWLMDNGAATKELEIAIKAVAPEFGGIDEILRRNDDVDKYED